MTWLDEVLTSSKIGKWMALGAVAWVVFATVAVTLAAKGLL